MGLHSNAWGRKTKHRPETATKTYTGTVEGEKGFATRATTENGARKQLMIQYNRKYGYKDHIPRNVIITSVS